MIARFNPNGGARIYPGSPFITQQLLRGPATSSSCSSCTRPTPSRSPATSRSWKPAARWPWLREDGFGSATSFLPPPSRRALVLIDPSYEIKSDYGSVCDCIGEALKRFATGTYVVWYPIIPRPEAHDLPRRLKTMATKAGKPWLHATLTVKSSKITTMTGRRSARASRPAACSSSTRLTRSSRLAAAAANGRRLGAGQARCVFTRQRRMRAMIECCHLRGCDLAPGVGWGCALCGCRRDLWPRRSPEMPPQRSDSLSTICSATCLMPSPIMPIASAAARLRSMMRPAA